MVPIGRVPRDAHQPDIMHPSPSSAPATVRPGDMIGTSRTATARAAAAHAQGSVPHSDTDADADTGSGSGSGSDLCLSIGSDAFVPLNKGPTSPTSPLAPYPPLSPTDTRSRAPEFYGFVAWTSTYLLFVLYLLWAFLPNEHILALGVSWYPNREWSLLVPAYGMVLVLLTYFTYFALALAGTPSFADMRTITDSKAHLPPPPPSSLSAATAAHSLEKEFDEEEEKEEKEEESAPPTGSGVYSRRAGARKVGWNPYRAQLRPDAIPELYDIPLGMVNRVVHGPHPHSRRGPFNRTETLAMASSSTRPVVHGKPDVRVDPVHPDPDVRHANL